MTPRRFATTSLRIVRHPVAVALIAIALHPVGNACGAFPPATTLGDLCPGTPMHCVVGGQFSIPNGTVFDLAGRILTLQSTAKLIGNNGAAFAFLNASTVTMQRGALITAMGEGVDGGTFTVTSTGLCTIGGKIAANARVGNRIGGSGGLVEFTCVGITFVAGGKIEVKGEAGPDGGGAFGGDVFLDGTSGPVSVEKGVRIEAGGKGLDGGRIDIVSGAACSVRGKLRASAALKSGNGGTGGDIMASCEDLSVPEGSIRSRGATGSLAGGTGGTVTLEGGAGEVVLGKSLKIDVTTKGDDGGMIEVTSNGACTIDGTMLTSCQRLVSGFGGAGGDVSAACNTGLTVNPTTRITATGLDRPGGLIDFFGGTGPVEIASGARIDAHSSGDTGGNVFIAGASTCAVAGEFQADSLARAGVNGLGGTFQVVCGGDLTLEGTLSATSGAVAGTIFIDACNLTVATDGVVDASGFQGGQNTLRAHDALTINGRVLAFSTDSQNPPGTNDLRYRNTVSITNPSNVDPSSVPVQDGTLSACP